MSEHERGKVKSIVRSEYMIDRYQVIFESGAGWHCVCAEFAKFDSCRHTRESEGRRAAQALIAQRERSAHGTLAGFANRENPSKSVAVTHTISKRK